MEHRFSEMNINMTQRDLFNSDTGIGIKDCVGREIVIVGFAIMPSSETDIEGKSTPPILAIKDSEGKLYSGTSIVIAGKLEQLYRVFGEDEIIGGIPIEFIQIKCGRGNGVSMLVK